MDDCNYQQIMGHCMGYVATPQPHHIPYNTLHPKKQLEMDRIGQKVEELYEQGSTELLPRDRPLFLKSLVTLKKGNGNEQE
jgi:hypothetical protein